MAYFRKLDPKLAKLQELLNKNERWLILINADPDALASAMALKRILAGRVEQVAIAHVNEITRPDNLAITDHVPHIQADSKPKRADLVPDLAKIPLTGVFQPEHGGKSGPVPQQSGKIPGPGRMEHITAWAQKGNFLLKGENHVANGGRTVLPGQVEGQMGMVGKAKFGQIRGQVEFIVVQAASCLKEHERHFPHHGGEDPAIGPDPIGDDAGWCGQPELHVGQNRLSCRSLRRTWRLMALLRNMSWGRRRTRDDRASFRVLPKTRRLAQ